MVSCNCIIINVRKSIPWIGILFTFSLLSAFSGYGFFFSITTTITSFFIFTFSTIFLTFSKQKTVVLFEEPKQEQEQDHRQEYSSPVPTCLMSTEQPKIETFSAEKKNIRSQNLLYSSESHDQLSSSDCQDSDDMDLVDDDRSPTECSDDDDGDSDSISDEESLIEIALPSGIYVGCPKHLEQDHHHHHQASFMELLAEINEMNEEENLIEIDLSMGSIKCSRFEIQA